MMSANEMVPVASSVFQVQGILDLVAILLGVVAIYSLIRLNKKLGGKLSAAINFFNLGMAANVLAILSQRAIFEAFLYSNARPINLTV